VLRIRDTGDPQAFDVLYRRHTPMLYAYAVRRLNDASDAEDAVHDTWLRAIAGIASFRGDSTVRTWLAGVLVNRIREARRRLHQAALDDVPDAELTMPEPVPLRADPIDLERAIAAMPAGYQEIVLLHDVEGFTHEEIGQMLGVTTGTSKSQLTRGRRWLRTRLEMTEDANDAG
jgi:RNA polymerase sigma factor (sigma-70 family)